METAPHRLRSSPRPKRRPSCLLPILALGVLACLLVAAAALAVFYVPQFARAAFGPPAPGLSLFDDIRLSARLLYYREDLTRPLSPGGEERPFEVGQGESTASIINRLEAEGFISNAGAFRTYLVYSGLDTSLQSGQYLLSPAQTPLEIAKALQDATPTQVTFNILPGWRLEEIAAALPTSGLPFSGEEFLAAAGQVPPGYELLAGLPPGATLEGFLLPGSYHLPRQISVEQFIRALLDAFAANLGPDVQQGFNAQGLSLYQAVTLASIVEREAVVEDEKPVIASVFLNRIAAGMKLDSDPTVQYALGYNASQSTWWTNPLTTDNLQVQSPYNTYIYGGLPPGPIANPDLASLRAVAFPAQTPYYYFRLGCNSDGRHAFAETYQQHLQNECR